MVTPGEFAILAVYYAAFALLTIYALHRFHLVRVLRRYRPAGQTLCPATGPSGLAESWPHLAVQLPLFNEPAVAARLIAAAAALQYPGRLEIQVIDDSTDQTSEIVARSVAEAQERGVDMTHLRRASRDGFKAGALAEGMRRSSAEMFAIFDADFVPQPDVLLHLVPSFADPSVGMVQARWGHLNRDQSALTRMQALYLDGHFAIESAARFFHGRFFNFNGTAGIWRRKAIVDAGGWSASTLTEDLDLSYRAQLAGWKFVFLPGIEVPAELPSTLAAFQAQQHRWTKGSIQTARKLLARILRSPIPWKQKAEAFFHLTGNVPYLMMLLVAVLLVPALDIRSRVSSPLMLAADAALFLASSVALLMFCLEGQRRLGRQPGWRDLLVAVPVGIGLSIANSAAVLEGLAQKGGEFVRTPKQGLAGGMRPPERRPRLPLAETLLVVLMISAAIGFALSGRWAATPFPVIFAGGFGYHLLLSAQDWAAYVRRRQAQ